MIGLLTFSEGILCKKEVLGISYTGQIAGVDVSISFPCSPDAFNQNPSLPVGINSPLLPPLQEKNLNQGNTEVFWGYPINYPSLSSFVKSVLVEINCQECECETVARKLYSAIGVWGDAIISYCRLCSTQNPFRNKCNQNTTASLKLFSTKGHIQDRSPRSLCGYIHSEDSFISKEQLEQAIFFAASGKELLLEYQMLLSAYEARKKLQNRQAIIDACSAAEICLVNRIKKYCCAKDIDSEILLNKYRSLGERFRLAAKLDDHFITIDYNNIIVKPRNDIAHNREVCPTDKTTDELISAIEQCLEHYHTRYY